MLQQIVNGLSIGSVYALMAVGYSLVYSLLNFTNFAHGVVVTAGAYLAFFTLTLVRPSFAVALLAAMVGGGLLSITYEILAYRPLLIKGGRRLFLIIAGLGISTIGENLIILRIGGRFKAYPPIFPMEPLHVGPVEIAVVDIMIVAVSLIALLIFQLIISRTRAGLAIRAAAHNLATAGLMGVNSDALVILVFLIAGTLAGLAGIFLGVKYTAYPQLGAMTLKAFISAVFGGLGSLPGAVAGAYALGILETFVSAYISSSMRDVFSFLLLVLVLLFRPQGLMGRPSGEKA